MGRRSVSVVQPRLAREDQRAERGGAFLDAQRAAHAPEDAALECEQSVIGALLLDGTAIQRLNGLRAADFGREEHRIVFQAIRDCAEDHGLIDFVTIADRLRKNGTAADQLVAYVGAIATNTPSSRHIERYAELVQEHARRRQIAAIGAELAERAAAPGADIAALLSEATARLTSMQEAKAGLQALDLHELANREPERPRQIMVGLPCGYVTLLAGHGGAGKSTIELTRAVSIAAGVPFFGLPVERRRVLYLSCEDRESVLHWRLARICAHLGVNLASLRGWLQVVDLVGQDSILWERDPRTGYTITPAFARLSEMVLEHETEVLFVDGTADTFGGNENARGEVKRYVNALVGLIPPERGAVLLVAHVAKATAANSATTEGYSGSTGWHNAARARWYLYPEAAQGDDGERTGDLILELQKSNLGRCDVQIKFRWDADAHLFLGELVGASTFDRRHQEREERARVLLAFRSCQVAAVTVPASMQGPRTAFHVLSVRPEFPETLRSGKVGTRRFWRIVEALRHIRQIEESEYRRTNGHKGSQLRLTSEGERHIAK